MMANLTLIPVLRCKVDIWGYSICVRKYGEAARRLSLCTSYSANQELGQLIRWRKSRSPRGFPLG